MNNILKELLHSIVLCLIIWYFSWQSYGTNLGIINFLVMVVVATGAGLLIKRYMNQKVDCFE
jgi:glycerol uptake facilitator-like aquaporin